MSIPKPRETCPKPSDLVSPQPAANQQRNHRNHFLKEGGELVSLLARHLAPLAPQQRYALGGFARWALTTQRLDHDR
jgi:hypothetical protein